MIHVRLRAIAAALALAPAAALLAAAPAQAAAADVTVRSVSVSKSAFVLSAKAGCTAAVTFSAVLSEPLPTTGYEFAGVGVDVFEPGNSRESVAGVEFSRVGSTSTYRGTVKLCGKYKAGNFKAQVYGLLLPTGGDESEYVFTNKVTKTISVKRPSKLTLNAAPEPVVKGKKLTAKGTLKVDGKVQSGASVKIYFKATGATTWTYKGTATTAAKGVYTKKFTATKSGSWKAVYAGTTAKTPASAGDAVKVK